MAQLREGPICHLPEKENKLKLINVFKNIALYIYKIKTVYALYQLYFDIV